MRIYLAGPDVFLKNCIEIGNKKKNLCQQYNLVGIFPMDNKVEIKTSKTIYDENISLLLSCDIVLANLSPFRGISADVGTAIEIGLGLAFNKLVYGYTNNEKTYKERARLLNDELLIEDYKEIDNLMITESIYESGGEIVKKDSSDLSALSAFEETLKIIRKE